MFPYILHNNNNEFAIFCIYKVGSINEDKKLLGISHFLEHMFFKGTRKYQTPKDVSYLIEGIGGEIKASTDREFTQYLIRVPNIYIERALDLLSEMFLYPKLELFLVLNPQGLIQPV